MLFSVLLVLAVGLVPADSKPTGRLQLIFCFKFSVMHHREFLSCACVSAEYLGSPLLQRCFEDAKKLVDDAYLYSREE